MQDFGNPTGVLELRPAFSELPMARGERAIGKIVIFSARVRPGTTVAGVIEHDALSFTREVRSSPMSMNS
jgi:hypothetical protein